MTEPMIKPIFKSQVLQKTIKFFCPELLKEEKVLDLLSKYIFQGNLKDRVSISKEMVVKQISTYSTSLDSKDLDHLMTTLDGYKVMVEENQLPGPVELDKHLLKQKESILEKLSTTFVF